MKKIITIIAVITLFNLTTMAKADEYDAMVDMVMNMMKQSGNVSRMSTCLDISEDSFLKKYKKTIEECISKDSLEGDCVETTAPKYFGMPLEQLDKCGGDDSDDEHADEEDDIDYSELSEEEVNALLIKKQAEGLAALEQMAAMIQASSKGTEHKISLPVYSPSTLRSHFLHGMRNSEGETTLPVATLTTKDSISKVVAFYKKALPKFEVDESQDIFRFMKKVPKDIFKLSLDLEKLPLYFIPHIEIYSMNGSDGDQTHIVISYKVK